jgi:hypothetical protein
MPSASRITNKGNESKLTNTTVNDVSSRKSTAVSTTTRIGSSGNTGGRNKRASFVCGSD